MTRILTAVAVALALGTGARAEEKPTRPDQLPLDDQFLIKAIEGQNNLNRTLELVANRSENEKVKQFAKTMLAEHKEIGQRFAEAAKERRVNVVVGPDKAAKEEYDRLAALKGAEFDREFLATFIRCHEKALAMCEGQLKEGKVNTLSTCATNCKNMIKEHIEKAKTLQKEIGK